MLIDEPTQGVDAKARFDIYRAIRAKAADGIGCIVNSSDALELAGICDRVLVFSRGRIVRELAGDEVSEENIVSSFLTAQARSPPRRRRGPSRADACCTQRLRDARRPAAAKWWVPLALPAGC